MFCGCYGEGRHARGACGGARRREPAALETERRCAIVANVGHARTERPLMAPADAMPYRCPEQEVA